MRLADEAVHEVRAELWTEREPARPTLTPEEIREWELSREERRKGQAGEGS